MSMGTILATLRKEKKLQQKDVAAILHLSSSTISNYETDVHTPDCVTLVRLADLYEVSTDYLLERTQYRHNYNQFDCHFIGKTSYGEIVTFMMELNPGNRKSLVEFMELLKCRHIQQSQTDSHRKKSPPK